MRRGEEMLKDWQVQRKTQGMALIISRLADALRRHALRSPYMLVKQSADDSLPASGRHCVCVCLWKGDMCVESFLNDFLENLTFPLETQTKPELKVNLERL